MNNYFLVLCLCLFGGGAAVFAAEPVDQSLEQLAAELGLTAEPLAKHPIPAVTDPLVVLGRRLFFTKSLGGGFDVACASCHHPQLGGGDALSLSIGVDAIDPKVLGRQRQHQRGRPRVPRNAPSTFNVAFWQKAMFWDGRVERLAEGFRTPESPFGSADPNAGEELVAVQSRFPMASVEEMRTRKFEQGAESQVVRDHLAARLGGYGVGLRELKTNAWLKEFQLGFASNADAEELITEKNIATALSAYQRSQVFIDTPWRRYLNGDLTALTARQKQGALLFLRQAADGGVGCVNCHSGDFFTDEGFYRLATPQIGHGKHNKNKDDFGRSRETRDHADRYRFRTPSLLNVAVTGPYMHNGAFDTLEQAIAHHLNPVGSNKRYWEQGGYCQLQQFANSENCVELYPQSEQNSAAALQWFLDSPDLNWSAIPAARRSDEAIQTLAAFLRALTDACVLDSECLAPWVPTAGPGPDGMQLNAVFSSAAAE